MNQYDKDHPHWSKWLFGIGFYLLSFSFSVQAEIPLLSKEQLDSPPPRIIRTCCSFGSEMRMAGIPLKRLTSITSLEKIGPHQYLGSREEQNGIIYTTRGGFIDLGHVRDQADWTAYLSALIQSEKDQELVNRRLGYEGGPKVLALYLPDEMSTANTALLAGRIAYDLSVWHEIATWFGTSYLPLIPERYSSFSIEDIYSNLLGVHLGIQAMNSELPYEKAMTLLLAETLDSLGAVQTEAETYEAMEAVEGLWWTRSKALPSKKVLLQHDLQIYSEVYPWQVPGYSDVLPSILQIPNQTIEGFSLSPHYQLTFRLNHKFPFRKLFPTRRERQISQDDFPVLMSWIEANVMSQRAKHRHQQVREKRKRYKKRRYATRL